MSPGYETLHPLIEYFLMLDGERRGPLSEEQVRASIVSGMVDRDTLLWLKGMAEWKPVGEIPELVNIFPELAELESIRGMLPFYRTYRGEYAPLGARIMAGAVDALILAILASGVYFLAPLYTPLPVLAYLWAFLSRIGGGATPGDMVMSLKTLDGTHGDPPGPFRSLWLCILLLLTFPFGWVSYFFDKRRRFVHNLLTGTLTVSGG